MILLRRFLLSFRFLSEHEIWHLQEMKTKANFCLIKEIFLNPSTLAHFKRALKQAGILQVHFLWI